MLVKTCISIVSVVCLGLCGCPLGTPKDHSQAIGQGNTSLAASPIYEPELRIYVANADNTAERLVTRDMGGCYSPVFSRTGDRLYFFQTVWPSGPTGVPKYNTWEATLDGTTTRQLADYGLFDNPLGWEPTHGR